MLKIPKKTHTRIKEHLSKYQKIAISHGKKDVSEADTVTVIKDVFSDVFGFDKYEDLTSEQQIKGTYCDLAVKLDDKIQILVEIKAAGVNLNLNHLRQAVDYGSKEGISWVVLTNGIQWLVHKIEFGKPITHDEVARFCLSDIDLKKEEDLAKLYLLTKEGLKAGALETFHQHSLLLNEYTMAQIIQHEAVLKSIRTNFRKIFPEVKLDIEQIKKLLVEDMLKRETIDSEKAKEAATKVKRIYNKLQRGAAKS